MTRRVLSLYLLLAAALFMRAVLPQGYMPERSESGSIAVVICGSGGVHRIPIGDGDDPESEQRAEPPCVFAGIATPLLPPAPAGLPLPAAVKLARADGRPLAIPRLAIRQIHPARGPPLAA